MSWSFSVKATPEAEFSDAAKEAFSAWSPTAPNAESVLQADIARTLAVLAVESGALGGKDKSFSASLSGHANRGNEPTVGWAKDQIFVNVVQS